MLTTDILLIDVHRKGHPIHFVIELLCWRHVWWACTWDTGIFTSFSHLRRSVHIFLPLRAFLSNFPIMFFSNPWPSRQSIGYSPWINEQSHILPFLLPNKTYDHVCCFKFCRLKISLHWYLSGLPQKGVVILQLSPSRWYLHNVQSPQ